VLGAVRGLGGAAARTEFLPVPRAAAPKAADGVSSVHRPVPPAQAVEAAT
jgi:hypothetical protein